METRIMIYMPEMVDFGFLSKKDDFFVIEIHTKNDNGMKLRFGLN